MLKSGFVFLNLCSCVFDLVLMFKSGAVFLSLYFCVWVYSLNGFGLILLKEMRFYGFVFLSFGACCVCILCCVLVFNFFWGFVLSYIMFYFCFCFLF